MVNATDPIERKRLQQRAAGDFVLAAIEGGIESADVRLRAELLAWLIANGYLEIRFALPEHTHDPGEYHEKLGVFYFPTGDEIAFSGSANESISGHRRNWEWIDAFRSWVDGDSARLEDRKSQFLESWFDESPGLSVVELSSDVLSRIKSTAPFERPSIPSHMKSAPDFSLRPHQEAALVAWDKNSRHGLLEMCTGSGKTITAIEACSRVVRSNLEVSERGTLVVIACPRKILVEQWDAEISRWRPEWLRLGAYQSASEYASRLPTWLAHDDADTYVVLTTYNTLMSDAFLGQLALHRDRIGSSVFVADEAHNLGSAERLDRLSDFLDAFSSTVALTATPEIEASPTRSRSLVSAFHGVVYSYGIFDAIRDGILCPYDYYPRPVFLSADLSREYLELLTRIESRESSRNVELYSRTRDLMRKSGVYVAELETIVGELTQQHGSELPRTVVFSPPGRDDSSERILAQVKSVFEKSGILVSGIIHETNEDQRKTSLESFRTGRTPVLLGIGCLDEGLDVPESEIAIILYSHDRAKQFIQRRGRVLRLAPGKDAASIFDLIILPQESDLPPPRMQEILERELRRYREFASGARNRDEAIRVIDDALEALGLEAESV